MKTLPFLASVILFINIISAAPPPSISTSSTDPCSEYENNIYDLNSNEIPSDENAISCEQTEYNEYLKCVEEKKDTVIKRKKRQICPYAAQQQQQQQEKTKNCKQINFDCRLRCANDKSCEDKCPICPLNIELLIKDPPLSQMNQQVMSECQETFDDCYNDCNQISTCEIGCLDQCPNPTGYRTVIVQGNDGTSTKFDGKIDAAHNITTIIKLTNIVNNTNIVNVPTNVNTTNVNNIHVYANTTDNKNGGQFGLGETDKGACCFAIRPKTCHTSTNGYRCHHKRHRTCGPQCTSRVIHVQSRKRCQKQGGCQNKIAYIPQPAPQNQRCGYTDRWPYVSCGGQQSSSCNGCFDHYGYGYENYHGADGGNECRGCYDDAFDTGPLYRRGPVLRPYYYHQPPCYITGTCFHGYYPGMDCGYGCYGHEMIDPAWGYDYGGYPMGMPGLRAPPMGGGGQYPSRAGDPDDEDYDEEDSVFDRNSKNNDTEGSGGSGGSLYDWGVPIHKCKVVLGDGTYEIRNCTESHFNDNTFAAAPYDYPYPSPYSPYAYGQLPPPPPPPNGYRLRRHTVNHNRMMMDNNNNNNYRQRKISFDDDDLDIDDNSTRYDDDDDDDDNENNMNIDEDNHFENGDDYDYDRRNYAPQRRQLPQRNHDARKQRRPRIIYDDDYDIYNNNNDMEYVD